METWLSIFLIWNKSNLKKCLGEPNSAAPKQVLCSVSEVWLFPRAVWSTEGWQMWHWGHGHSSLCLDTLRGQCQLGMPSRALGFLWKLLHAKPVGLEQSVRTSGWFCVCWMELLAPPSPPLNHLWVYHLSSTALQKGWIACVFLTNHPSVTLTHLSSQIREHWWTLRSSLVSLAKQRPLCVVKFTDLLGPNGIISPPKFFLLSLNKKE